MRVQPVSFFALSQKFNFLWIFLMKQVKFFNFFSSRFFNMKNFEKTIKKTIELQRRDLKLKSHARIKSTHKKKGEMAAVFIRRGPLDPLWPSLYFSEVWPQRVKRKCLSFLQYFRPIKILCRTLCFLVSQRTRIN